MGTKEGNCHELLLTGEPKSGVSVVLLLPGVCVWGGDRHKLSTDVERWMHKSNDAFNAGIEAPFGVEAAGGNLGRTEFLTVLY